MVFVLASVPKALARPQLPLPDDASPGAESLPVGTWAHPRNVGQMVGTGEGKVHAWSGLCQGLPVTGWRAGPAC